MNQAFITENYDAEGIRAPNSKPSIDILLKDKSYIMGSEEILDSTFSKGHVYFDITDEEKKQNLFGFPIVEFKNDKEVSESENSHNVTETEENRGEQTICIPPWAKTLRKSQDDARKSSDESTESIRHKIRNIVNNYSEAMLVKRVENQEKVIIEPNKYNNFEAIKRSKTNTRYYLAPLYKSDERIFKRNSDHNTVSVSAGVPRIKDHISDISMASKGQAKKEVSNIIKSLKIKSDDNKAALIDKKSSLGTKKKAACQKLTVNQIRSYVENKMSDPNERQLHEIIKVETVPSKTMLGEQKHIRQYTINIPKGDFNDINVVKIKEKRKLQTNKVEETNGVDPESQAKQQIKEEIDYNTVKYSSKPEKIIRKLEKSPVETRVFEVKTLKAPTISPLIDESKRNQMLLIEREINYKPKHKGQGMSTTNLKKTQLLGIQHCTELEDEIYMYDTETRGKHVKENINKIEEVSPSLKQKVKSIFEELKGITFRQKSPEPIISKTHVSSGTNTEDNNYLPSNILSEDKQRIHDVKSAAVQVRKSELVRKLSSKEVTSKYSTPSPPKKLPVSNQESEEAGKLDVFKETETLDFLQKKSISHTSIIKRRKHSEIPEMHRSLSKDQVPKDYLLKTSESSGDMGYTTETDTVRGSLKIKMETDTTRGSLKTTMETDAVRGSLKTTMETDTVRGSLKTTLESHPLITGQDVKQQLKNNQSNLELKTEETKAVEMNEEPIDESKQMEEKGPVKLEIIDNEKLEVEYDYENESVKVKEGELTDKYDQLQQDKDEYGQTEDTEASPSKQDLKYQAKVLVKSAEDTLKLSLPRESYINTSTPDEKSLTLEDMIDRDATVQRKSFGEIEDIRSYNIDPSQEKEFALQSDSKFNLKKEKVRKKMNWSDNTIYLENQMCPQIIKALAETAMRTPAAPISYLANLIYKDYQNNTREYEKYVFQEHLNLARSMKGLSIDKNPGT